MAIAPSLIAPRYKGNKIAINDQGAVSSAKIFAQGKVLARQDYLARPYLNQRLSSVSRDPEAPSHRALNQIFGAQGRHGRLRTGRSRGQDDGKGERHASGPSSGLRTCAQPPGRLACSPVDHP